MFVGCSEGTIKELLREYVLEVKEGEGDII